MSSSKRPKPLKTLLITCATLLAFAANSVLGRAALTADSNGELPIDPFSFTSLRIASGAAMLAVIVWFMKRRDPSIRWQCSWSSALSLFVYAIAFSLAYLSLSAGTGALILFGLVQATMISWGIRSGERPSIWEWFGFSTAFVGLIVLVSPGIEPPSPTGAILMAIAGIAWGVYSLRGRGQTQPVLATAGNFALAVPLALGVSAITLPWAHASSRGALLAVVSGAITSGLGYVCWYTALKGLSATRAAMVQLSVPVIAAVGGVVALGESLSLRLVVATVLVLGGIAAAIAIKSRRQ